MDKGYKLIAWGYIFITFHINLGWTYILPGCICYLIIYCGINKVSRNYEIKALSESAKCCGVLTVMSFIIGFVSLYKENIFIENPAFHILWLTGFGIIDIVFIYKFLKGSSEILEDRGSTLSSMYDKKACIYVVLASISLVVCNINVALMIKSIWIAVGIFEFCLNIWIIHFSRKLGKIVKKQLPDSN